MNKELEALNDYIKLSVLVKTNEVTYQDSINELNKYYNVFKQSLTPPSIKQLEKEIDAKDIVEVIKNTKK